MAAFPLRLVYVPVGCAAARRFCLCVRVSTMISSVIAVTFALVFIICSRCSRALSTALVGGIGHDGNYEQRAAT